MNRIINFINKINKLNGSALHGLGFGTFMIIGVTLGILIVLIGFIIYFFIK